MRRMACRVCVTAVLGALASTSALAAGIATVTGVVNDGYRQPPGDSERRAAAADELVSDEALRTDRDSSIALRFIDGSELRFQVPDGASVLPGLLRGMVDNDIDLTGVEVHRPTLDDVFLTLTGRSLREDNVTAEADQAA